MTKAKDGDKRKDIIIDGHLQHRSVQNYMRVSSRCTIIKNKATCTALT